MLLRNNTIVKSISAFLIAIFLGEFFHPIILWANSSGPVQADHLAPVTGENNLVNTFSGAFTYNIPVLTVPGPNGSDFPVNLVYNSGSVKPESDATWVGFGWSLDVGAITRDKIGTADDMLGEPVEYTTYTEPNITVAYTPPLSMQESFDVKSAGSISASGSVSFKYNSQTGYSLCYGLSASIFGYGSLGLNVDDQGLSYNVGVGYPFSMALGSQTMDVIKTLDNGGQLLEQGTMETASMDMGKVGGGYAGSLWSHSEKQLQTKVSSYTGNSIITDYGNVENSYLLKGSKDEYSITYTTTKSWSVDKHDAYGLMYAGNRYESYPDGRYKDNSEGDYLLEKEKGMNLKRLKFLSIPYNAADRFSVSAPGLAGSFRLYQKNTGHHAPYHTQGGISIEHLGGDNMKKQTNTNGTEGIGVTLGYGESNTSTEEVGTGTGLSYIPTDRYQEQDYDGINTRTWCYNNGEPYFFRMVGDLGGGVSYGSNTTPQRSVDKDGSIDRASINPEVNKGNKVGRSVFIGCRTHAQVSTRNLKNDKFVLPYNKRRSHILTVSPDNGENYPEDRRRAQENSIAEFAVVNSNGSKYVYGLPVYQWNETTLSGGLKKWSSSVSSDLINGNAYDAGNDNYIIKSDKIATIDAKNPDHTFIKEFRPAQKATQYLLTQITSPDYVDRTMDGPTPDDFGSYTIFHYERAGGDYRWRSPYVGYMYQKGLHSDPRDDMGTVSYGDREVYYISRIETKTHVAVFVLNSPQTEPRKDGLSAYSSEADAGIGTGSSLRSAQRYLKQIKLYTREQFENSSLSSEWLSRVNFEYDYSLMKGAPNALDNNTGKLTLKKVWTESNGVVESTIAAPYVFKYEYPVLSSSNSFSPIPQQYDNFFPYIAASVNQNPDYNVSNADCWGNYQKNGAGRKKIYNPWMDQTPEAFDPAAWMLKEIVLPSGGSILVQYEQNEYRYVQDKLAMVMTSLSSVDGRDHRHYLNVENDLALSSDEKNQLSGEIYKRFVLGRERMYFKFLYPMKTPSSNSNSFPSDGHCDYEYINGYAQIKECGIDNTGRVWVEFEQEYPGTPNLLGVASVPFDKVAQPAKAMMDFQFINNGSLVDGGDCTTGGLFSDGNIASAMATLTSKIVVFKDLYTTIFNTNQNCKPVALHSYLRVPSIKAKKGAGVRVKRILMYNPARSLEAISGGDEGLYGTEYLYETAEGDKIVSSGVATNEPPSIREENALVGVVKEFEDDRTEGQVIAGNNIVQYEGPLGENLLPGPSVGYSRVVAKNIHQGKTTNGYLVYDYYTAKEYPSVAIQKTDLDKHNNDEFPFGISIWALMVKYNRQTARASQGFTFVVNDMHGKLHCVKKYAGTYLATDPHRISQRDSYESMEYTYFDYKEPVPVIYGPDKPLRMEYLGRETDVAIEGKEIEATSDNGTVQFSLGTSLLSQSNNPPDPVPYPVTIPMMSLAPLVDFSYEQTRTHVVNKVVNCTAILQSTTAYKEGIYHKTDNIAFDPKTGNAAIVQTTDGHDKLSLLSNTHQGTFTTYTIPAWQRYSNLSDISDCENFILYDKNMDSQNDAAFNARYGILDINTANLSTNHEINITIDALNSATEYPTIPWLSSDVNGRLMDMQRHFHSGDLVCIRAIGSSSTSTVNRSYFTVGETTLDIATKTLRLSVLPSIAEAHSNASFNIETGNILSLEVINSGARNQVQSGVTSVVTYGEERGLTAAVEYAKQLRAREEYANMLNDDLYRRFNSADNLPQNLYEASLSWDQHLLYVHTANNVSTNIAVGQSFGVAYNPLANPVSPFHFVMYYMPLTKNLLIAWTQVSPPHNYQCVVPVGGTNVPLKVELPMTGMERFGVNDDGDLTYYSFVNEQTNIRPCPLNFNPGQLGLGTRVNAFRGTNPYSTTGAQSGVISINGSKLSDDWDYTALGIVPTTSDYDTPNKYEDGRKGIWRATDGFIYQSAIKGGANTSITTPDIERNYKGGAVDVAFSASDLIPSTSTGSLWIKNSTTTHYSPNSNVLSSTNILGIASSSRYSHNMTMPSIVATNAEYPSLNFISFEDDNSSYISTNKTHSGKKSMRIEGSGEFASGISGNSHLQSSKLNMRFWLKYPYPTLNQGDSKLSISLSGATLINSSIRFLAQNGDWKLVEALADCNGTTNIGYSFTYNNHDPVTGGYFYIDDIRFMPADAQASCYVYDDITKRIMAVFDDDHFGMFYQYDGEGKLVRKVAETAQGSKTIAEQVSNKLRYNRNSSGGGGGNGGNGTQLFNPQSGNRGTSIQESLHYDDVGNTPGLGGKVDLLDINITPDKKDIKILGNKKAKVPMIISPSALSDTLQQKRPSISLPNIIGDTIGIRRQVQNGMHDLKEIQDSLSTHLKKNKDTSKTTPSQSKQK